MGRRFYRTGQFAKKAAVSVRTLRYYDKQGLLSPTDHTDTGYRLYSDDDLSELQQILALKFLGFTLEEIRAFRRTGPERLGGALANQKAMMQDRRAQIEAIIDAIEHAQKRLAAGACDWDAITHVIEVMQMENKKEWVDKYFTPEQRATMERLSATSYSDKAKRKMAGRSAAWTEQDQKRVDAQYAHIAADLERLEAAGEDPGSPAAQEVAKLQVDLLQQFTQGDPDIEAGLNSWWQNFDALPEADKPPALPWSKEEGVFLGKALDLYRERHA